MAAQPGNGHWSVCMRSSAPWLLVEGFGRVKWRKGDWWWKERLDKTLPNNTPKPQWLVIRESRGGIRRSEISGCSSDVRRRSNCASVRIRGLSPHRLGAFQIMEIWLVGNFEPTKHMRSQTLQANNANYVYVLSGSSFGLQFHVCKSDWWWKTYRRISQACHFSY